MTNFKWPLNRPAWATLWDMDTRPLGLLTELCSGNWPIAYSSLMLCVPYIRNIVLSFGPAHKSFGKRQSGRKLPKKQKTKDERLFCSEHFQICRSGDLSSWDLANDDLRTGCIKPWTHRLIIFSSRLDFSTWSSKLSSSSSSLFCLQSKEEESQSR